MQSFKDLLGQVHGSRGRGKALSRQLSERGSWNVTFVFQCPFCLCFNKPNISAGRENKQTKPNAKTRAKPAKASPGVC